MSIEDGEIFAKEINVIFFEISTINNDNIDNNNSMINNYYRYFPEILDDEDNKFERK